MKFNRAFLLLLAVSLLPVEGPARAEDGSLASLFTNANATHSTVFPRRASIILIACHGLAVGDLSCYGQTNFLTPNIDKLAAEGARFTDYNAASDQFAEAQAALMAGNTGGFSSGTPTVAGRLQEVGYHTGLIGEWSLGQQPWAQGFDEFTGFRNEQDARDYFAGSFWRYMPRNGYDQNGQRLAPYVGPEPVYENSGGQKNRFIPDLFLTAAGNFVKVNKPNEANHYQPFFLLLSLPVPESATPGKDDYPVPTDAPFSGEKWPQAAKNRAAMISRVDTDIGALLEQIQTVHMTNNLIIVLAGAVAPPAFADTNLNFLKLAGEVRGGESVDRLRVPLIVHWPGHVSGGSVCTQACSAADFAPTALQVGFHKPVANFTGQSLLPLVTVQREAKRPSTPGSQTP